jgi:hypothetical protein
MLMSSAMTMLRSAVFPFLSSASHAVLQTSADVDRPNEYDDMRIRVWRAFGVGAGKLVQLTHVKADLRGLVPLKVDASTQHENNLWKLEASSQGTCSSGIDAQRQTSSASIFRRQTER